MSGCVGASRGVSVGRRAGRSGAVGPGEASRSAGGLTRLGTPRTVAQSTPASTHVSCVTAVWVWSRRRTNLDLGVCPREQAYVSTEQPAPEQDPRLSVAHAYASWSGHPRRAPAQGPDTPRCLIRGRCSCACPRQSNAPTSGLPTRRSSGRPCVEHHCRRVCSVLRRRGSPSSGAGGEQGRGERGGAKPGQTPSAACRSPSLVAPRPGPGRRARQAPCCDGGL